ncbi:MAG TPA: AMP-binding protein, partial [Jatrophihabitans sp.]|nr:AMP-binding protein [Jatrophihabitans sp.]
MTISRSPATPSRVGTVGWPEDVAARYVAEGYWEGRTLSAPIYDTAEVAPDAVAVVDGSSRLSYRDLTERADGAALRLRALGLGPDDRIVMQLPNCWEFVVLTLACLRLGVIPVMGLTAHRRHEMSFLAAHSEARAIVVPGMVKDFDHQAMAREIAENTVTVEHVLVAGEDVLPGSVSLSELCQPAAYPAAARQELDQAAPDSRSVALMLLSGGTTGLPKLIARTHDDYGCYVRRTLEICEFDADTVSLVLLPLGHSMPLGTNLAVLRAGGRLVIASSPAPPGVLGVIADERVTVTAAVPAVAQRWLEYRESDSSHDLSSLRILLVGGARPADHVARAIAPALARILQQGYGMAEGLVCLTRPGDPVEVALHTQGRPITDADELRLVDDAGRPAAPGEPGVLLTRGPCTPRGYYRAEEYNASAFVDDGWLRTGDIVRQRPDGNLIIEGRDKDLINRGGEKVSAEEVESFAYRLAGVRLAAAVAMPDHQLGERVCLYVVAWPGASVRLADLRELMVAEGVAAFKLPERLVLVD